MALYALDGADLVYAPNASERKTYKCSGCGHPVRVRRGRFRNPHYYHLRSAPSCRLYSKSEDHLVAQLYIQKLLPPGEALIEHPLLPINRVADVLWEPARIVFEIQCSLLTPFELKSRIEDYAKIGYRIVWLLDDRIYNRRHLRPAEEEIRLTTSYYAKLRREPFPLFYDQFEVLFQNQRIKKGKQLPVSLQNPGYLPPLDWKPTSYPRQVLAKPHGSLYFQGDLLYKALLAEKVPTLAHAMHNLRFLERLFTKRAKYELSRWRRLIRAWFLEPLGYILIKLHERAEKN